ncbi:MAG: hypothetical protein L0154_04915 [Chloroflexi bacterium]|nr:hypothetical protein [Chloroflexota bacterium]
MSNNPFNQPNQSGTANSTPFAPVEAPAPRRRSTTRLVCLWVVGLTLLCCVGCVIAYIVVVFNNRPAVPAILWLGSAQMGNASDSEAWVCEGSQAETFTAGFAEQYTGITGIEWLDYEVDNDANTFRFGGAITYDGGVETVDYLFIIDPDGGETLGTFGCISEIQVNE